MLMTHGAELAIAEMHAALDALWRARDHDPSAIGMQELLKIQMEADGYLAQWAAENWMPCDTPEERADALDALRRKNAEVVMGGARTAEGTAE